MQNKIVIAIILVFVLSLGYHTFFSDAGSSAGETVSEFGSGSSGAQRVSGLPDAYAQLTDITKNGCRLHISGNSQYELSSHFVLFQNQGGEMVPMQTLSDFPDMRTWALSPSGIAKDYNWTEFYGSLPKGEYSILFTLIQGSGSVSFSQDFVIS